MTDVFASASGPWSGRSGIRFEGSAYLVRYFDADEFDQSQIAGGAFYDWRPGKWRIQLGVRASGLRLAGDAYDRKVGARLRLVRYLTPDSSIDVRYIHEDVTEADPLYVGIGGTRRQFDAQYGWYRNGHRLQLRYGLEINDRLDPAVSPTRNRLGVLYRFRPEVGLGYEAGIDLRHSEFDELATPRDEDLLTLRAGLSYEFWNNWLLMLEYRQSNNDSTDETFSYERGRLMLGAIKEF